MTARLPLIDALKAVASQVIVLHHLAIYGPMSDAVRPWSAGLVDAIDAYGRLAVQVFLVIAGFLAARAIAPDGVPRVDAPLAAVRRRWWRLFGPYAAALAVAVLAAALARTWTDHDTVPDAPTALQLLANLAMLQDVLGVEALSAGVWYVAIDLQLFACLVALAWAARRVGGAATLPVLVVALAAASLLGFNRDARWDVWAPYYFGSYALGVLAAWASAARADALRGTALAALVALAAAALAADFRSRIALASATALLLVLGTRVAAGATAGPRPVLGWLGRISFSVFLVHYPVIVLFDAASARWLGDAPLPNAIALALAFVASTAAGHAFHRWVEAPLSPARAATPVPPRPAPPGAPDVDDDDAPATSIGPRVR